MSRQGTVCSYAKCSDGCHSRLDTRPPSQTRAIDQTHSSASTVWAKLCPVILSQLLTAWAELEHVAMPLIFPALEARRVPHAVWLEPAFLAYQSHATKRGANLIQVPLEPA